MGLIDAILSDPLLVTLLGIVLAGVVIWQRTLGWRTYRTLHGLKVLLAPLLNRRTGLFILSRKGYRDDAEYLATIDRPVKQVWQGLVNAGGSPHLINSVKVRETPDNLRQYSAGHVVWIHEDGDQTEAYLFANGDNTSDVYSHHEPAVTDPDAHLGGDQHDGDPHGVVTDALPDSS